MHIHHSPISRLALRSPAFQILLIGSVLGLGSARAEFVPVPLPDPHIAGYTFPEKEATLLSWVAGMNAGNNPSVIKTNFNNLHLHGWGIWTALTTVTDQEEDGQKLRVFETWLRPEDITAAAPGPESNKFMLLQKTPRRRAPLQEFDQFKHRKKLNPELLMLPNAGQATVVGFVKYDPSAVEHITQQGLLSTATLNALLAGGAKNVPTFPSTAFALKPVFEVLAKAKLVGGRYFRLNVWSGPPATPKAFGEGSWPTWVWIDVQNGGHGAGKTDPVGAPDGSSRTDDTTYPVSAFINFQLSAQQSAALNETFFKGPQAQTATGDFAVLLAMHVAGKEITRWTWQTFWWTPTPDDPKFPSSTNIAALRPAQLTAPARNYAMSLAYSTQNPADPETGGNNNGESVYAYNPYLEAGFDPSILPDSIPGKYQGKTVANNYGVQTNCMSCHEMANFNPKNVPTAPDYTGARYVDLDAAQFKGTLQVDFLWSIPAKAK